MRVVQKKDGKNRIVEVSGSLTVTNSGELKKKILGNFRKGNNLELVLGDVTEVDLSFIQIIAAVVKTAEKGDREFSVRTPVPEKLIDSLKLAGLLNHGKCSNRNCLWCSINEQIQGA